MKIRKIYCEDSEMNDMSRDRVHLNLSYAEWREIKTLVDNARWIIDAKDSKDVKKMATNIQKMFEHAEQLEPIWTNKDGVVTK